VDHFQSNRAYHADLERLQDQLEDYAGTLHLQKLAWPSPGVAAYLYMTWAEIVDLEGEQSDAKFPRHVDEGDPPELEPTLETMPHGESIGTPTDA
jgi:hypothetical protein